METLSPGTELGPYRVEELIGVGGMGRVYKATDTRLRRRVAIKTSDERFGKRFEREAQAIASLSHPHICTIYDVGPDYLVMEFVEGGTLVDRLSQGPLPLEEALEIAGQIAEALEAAHEKGIIHRDLKPSNIKIDSDGAVKVLDFGLAKIVQEGTAEATAVDDLTRGVILGTPAYMAPEQVQGKPVDKRADIWAFGVVLYEMLAGEPPFRGASEADTLAAVLAGELDWTPIPTKVQPVLRRCLARDRKCRLHDIGDYALWLEDEPIGASRPGPRDAMPRWRLAAAGVVAAALVAFVGWQQWARTAGPDFAEPVRMTVSLPPGITVTRGVGFGVSALALSPDGRTLVIAGTDEGGQQRLYARSLERVEATFIEGTEGGSGPFFSPDGSWIGFFADGRLKRIPASGGAAVDIVAVSGFPAGASWGPDGRIVFVAGARSLVQAVDAAGGPAETLTRIEAGDGRGHFRPELLPDGRTLLFETGGRIHALDLASGRRAAVAEGAAPRYAATGHVVFVRGATLLAAPFDAAQLALAGPAVPVVEAVAADPLTSGGHHYTISANGNLAYVPATTAHELVYRNADGSERLVTQQRPGFENPQFSPDGTKLAVATDRRAGEPVDIWIHDLDTGAASRLTFDGGRAPVWTPDGKAVTFSHLGEQQGIYTKRVDGQGEAEKLLALDDFHWLVGWTPDGRTLAFGRMEGTAEDGTSKSSIIAVTGGHTQRVVGPGHIWGGRLSPPDGRWLAYYMLESGRFEVYVTPFPEGGTRWLISDQGGTDPSWGPDGKEIYYRSADRLLAARIDTAAGVRVVSRRLVVEPFTPPGYDDYHVHPDARSLVLVRPVTRSQEVLMVLDWFTELQRAVAP